MLLVILFLRLPKLSLGGLKFLLHLYLENLIILALVDPIQLEASIILLLMVFIFLLEANLKLGGKLNLGGNLKLRDNLNMGSNLKLEKIT
jgi:hypothetical protein